MQLAQVERGTLHAEVRLDLLVLAVADAQLIGQVGTPCTFLRKSAIV